MGMLEDLDSTEQLHRYMNEQRNLDRARYEQANKPADGLALARLMHIIRGGRPSRDPNWDPRKLGPGMLGPVNGAFPAPRGPYPPRTTSAMTVRG